MQAVLRIHVNVTHKLVVKTVIIQVAHQIFVNVIHKLVVTVIIQVAHQIFVNVIHSNQDIAQIIAVVIHIQ